MRMAMRWTEKWEMVSLSPGFCFERERVWRDLGWLRCSMCEIVEEDRLLISFALIISACLAVCMCIASSSPLLPSPLFYPSSWLLTPSLWNLPRQPRPLAKRSKTSTLDPLTYSVHHPTPRGITTPRGTCYLVKRQVGTFPNVHDARPA